MSRYVQNRDENGNIFYVEVDDVQDSSSTVSSGQLITGQIENRIDDAVRVAEASISQLKRLNVEEIEVEFGIKVGVEAGVSFWAISKATSEANITVKAKWTAVKQETD